MIYGLILMMMMMMMMMMMVVVMMMMMMVMMGVIMFLRATSLRFYQFCDDFACLKPLFFMALNLQ